MQVDGIPDGYELVRIGTPNKGEMFLSSDGLVYLSSGCVSGASWVILRKVERPKTYRPFRDGAEYAWHFDRPVRFKHEPNTVYRIASFNNLFVFVAYGDGVSFVDGMKDLVFADDGTPFGVEVSESSKPPITRPAQTY